MSKPLVIAPLRCRTCNLKLTPRTAYRITRPNGDRRVVDPWNYCDKCATEQSKLPLDAPALEGRHVPTEKTLSGDYKCLVCWTIFPASDLGVSGKCSPK